MTSLFTRLLLTIICTISSATRTCPSLSGINYELPSVSTFPDSIAFSPNGLYLATANVYSLGSTVDVTLFSVGTGGTLSGAYSYPLASGATGFTQISFSPNSSYLAVANQGLNTVTLFTAEPEGTLIGGNAYALPSGSTSPLSVSFSPDGLYCATANLTSNDVTIFTVGAGGI